jgi:hypothetical protein
LGEWSRGERVRRLGFGVGRGRLGDLRREALERF